MTTTETTGRSGRRPALTGFLVGFAMAFVATFLALAFTFFERIHAFLVPASVILQPLSDRMASWNGLLNMVLGGLVNGAVYAGVFALVAAVLPGRRRDQR